MVASKKNVAIRSLPDPTGGLEVTNWSKYKKEWSHLQDVPFLEIPEGLKVDMIIGNDQTYLHRSLKEVTHTSDINAPIARLTPLGVDSSWETSSTRKNNTSQDTQDGSNHL